MNTFWSWSDHMRLERNCYARNVADEILIRQRLKLDCNPEHTPLSYYLERFELWSWRAEALHMETEAIRIGNAP